MKLQRNIHRKWKIKCYKWNGRFDKYKRILRKKRNALTPTKQSKNKNCATKTCRQYLVIFLTVTVKSNYRNTKCMRRTETKNRKQTKKHEILFTMSQTQQMKTSALDVLLTTFQVNVSLLFVCYIIIIIFLYFFFYFSLLFFTLFDLCFWHIFFPRNLTRYRYWQSGKLHKQTTWTILNLKCVNIMIFNENQWIVIF